MWIFLSFRFYVKSTFEDSRSAETATFANLGAGHFVTLVNIRLQKVPKNSYKSKFRASKCVKTADFALLESPKLISHKI